MTAGHRLEGLGGLPLGVGHDASAVLGGVDVRGDEARRTFVTRQSLRDVLNGLCGTGPALPAGGVDRLATLLAYCAENLT